MRKTIMPNKFFLALLCALSILFLAISTRAYDVTLEWTQNPTNEQITGYVVCHKPYQSPGAYQEEHVMLNSGRFVIPTDKPQRIRYTFSDLTNGAYYEFSIKAFRIDAGVTYESDYSLSVNNYNHSPSITSLTATPETIRDNQTATLTASASDPEGDPLSYTWVPAAGVTINGNGPIVSFVPPKVATQTQFITTLEVSDNRGNSTNRSVSLSVLPAEISPPSEGQYPWKSASSLYPNQSEGHILSSANTGYEFTPQKDGAITDVCGNFLGSSEVALWENARIENGVRRADLITKIVLEASDNSDYTWRCESLIEPVFVNSATRYAVTMLAKMDVALMQTSGVDFELQSGDITIHYPLIGEINQTATDYPEYNTSIMTGQVDVRFATSAGTNRPPVITGLHAEPSTIDIDQTTLITASAHDPDNDDLLYSFTLNPDCLSSGCSLATNQDTATFSPSPVEQDTSYTIQLRVSDDRGGQSQATTNVTVLAPTPSPPPSSGQKPWQTISAQYPHHEGGHRFSSANTGYEFTAARDGRITQVGGNFIGTTEIVLWENVRNVDGERKADRITRATLEASDNPDYQWHFIDLPVSIKIQAGRRYAITMHAAYEVALMQTPDTLFENRSGDITIHFPLIGEVDQGPYDYPEYNTSIMTGQVDIFFIPD